MSKVNTTEHTGDVSVTRHVNVGGDVGIKGGATVRLNLRVEGWLDAKNIKGACKGLYGSADALLSAYPKPFVGWWALVGNGFPADVYVVSGGTWVSTGTSSDGVVVDMDVYSKAVAAMNEDLATEVAERKDGDSALDAKVSAEVKAREEGDTALQEGLDAEVKAREEGDAALQESLDAEVKAREDGDKALKDNLDAEVAAQAEKNQMFTDKINGMVPPESIDLDAVTGELSVSFPETSVEISDASQLNEVTGEVEIIYEFNID